MRTLEIFDFDGTMFANPTPTRELWTSKEYGVLNEAWYRAPESLNTPYVPALPDGEWWNQEMVDRALEVAADPDRVGVLMTGRRRVFFFDRVIELCVNRGLGYDVFSEFLLKPEGHTTFDFKFGEVRRMLESYGVDRIVMWDDRRKHVERFNKFFHEQGLPGVCNQIDWKPPAFLTREQELELGRMVLARG